MLGFIYLLPSYFRQWQRSESLQRLQSQRLQRLVRQAYDSVPYYRHLFDESDLRPGMIQTAEDVEKIPVTSKKQFQKLSFEERLSSKIKPEECHWKSTSGSTGIPLKLAFSHRDALVNGVTWIRALQAHGAQPWHSKLEITGPHHAGKSERWYNRLGLWKTYVISILEHPSKWVENWRRNQPDILYGYSGSLKLFARYVLEMKVDEIRPKLIFGVSDMTDPECREIIPLAFGTKLIDLYGAAESGLIAWECPVCNDYHLNLDTVVVEASERVSSSGSNPVIVTNLFSNAMPIIRYELGDLFIPSTDTVTCGRGMPLIKAIEGRSDARVFLDSGRAISPMTWFSVMKPLKGINEWRVLQTVLDQIQVLIVANRKVETSTAQEIEYHINKSVSGLRKIDIEFVDSIPRDPSGKIRSVISTLDKETEKLSG